MPVREYEHVPPSGVLGADVVHCTCCGKRLAPHDAFPVRDTDGKWSCIVCPASIAPRTFTAPMLDASRPGLVRDVTIEVHSRSLIVRVSAARVGGEDAPHHRAADFTEQRPAIVAAFPEVVTEIANAAKVGVDTGFAAGVKAGLARVEQMIEAKLTRIGPTDAYTATGIGELRGLLADIRSGATS